MKTANVCGQAFENGILMKSANKAVICMYDKNKNIISREINHDSILSSRSCKNAANLPIIRGTVSFLESLRLISKSFDVMADCGVNNTCKKSYFFKSTSFLLIFFFVIPIFLAELPVISGFKQQYSEAVIKLLIFLAYTVFTALSEKRRNILKYHGAEHKVINCSENGLRMSIENAAGCSRLHPRCGTNITCITAVLYTLLSCVIPWDNAFARLVAELAMLPVIIGISYEVVAITVKSRSKLLEFSVNMPGKVLQLFTTMEPDEIHLRLALESFEICTCKNSAERSHNP